MKNKIKKICNSRVLVAILIEIIIFIIKYFVIKETLPFTDIADEVASLAVPAYFAGYKWEECMTMASYYGFGFNILFTPLFYLKLDVQTIYKIILLVTAIIEGIIPIIVQYIYYHYFRIKNILKVSLVSIVISFITVNPLYNLINEHVLIILLWLEVLVLFKLVYSTKKVEKRIYSIVLVSILIYGTFIHTRNITIIIATCIGIVLYRWIYNTWIVEKKFFVILLFGYLGADYIVEYVQKLVWGSSSLQNTTVQVSFSNSVDLYGMIRGLVRILGGNLGTIIYFYKALPFFLLFAIIYYIYNCSFNIKKDDDSKKQSRVIVLIVTIFALAMGATLLMLGIQNAEGLQNIIVDKNVWAIKSLTYLRYYILYSGPLCMIACFLLIEYSAIYEKISKSAFGFTILVLVMWLLYIAPIVSNSYFGVSSFYPFSCIIGQTGTLDIKDFTLLTVIMINLLFIVFILIRNSKKNIVLLILSLLLIQQYMYFPDNYSIPVATSFYNEIDKSVEYLKKQEIEELYVNDERNLLLYMYQAHFYQIPVKKYDIRKIECGDVIVSNKKLDDFVKQNYEEIVIDKNEWIYVVK